MKVTQWWKLTSDESYLVMKFEIVKGVKRSDGLWRFACGDVFSLSLSAVNWGLQTETHITNCEAKGDTQTRCFSEMICVSFDLLLNFALLCFCHVPGKGWDLDQSWLTSQRPKGLSLVSREKSLVGELGKENTWIWFLVTITIWTKGGI